MGVSSNTASARLDRIASRARLLPGLEVLLLLGSRARGDTHVLSDWDFGYLATPDLDLATLVTLLTEVLETDRVDVADLGRASGLFRYRAARDGVALVEAAPGIADRFRLEAARFWYDVAPVLERGYEEVLAELPS